MKIIYEKEIHQFKGKIAKFSTVGLKELVLFTDVKIWSEENQKWEDFRDHMWCENRVKNRSLQGRKVTFKGQKYSYSNSIGAIQEAVVIKFPQLIMPLKKKGKYDNKKLQKNK